MKLATLPLVVLLAMVSWASGQITEGDWTYVVENGGATITGSTATGDVTIPSELGGYPVTSIGNSAFYGSLGLTSVIIPNSVTSLGALAFSWCTGLTSVNIGNSVTSIGEAAFINCGALTSVNIGNSVTSIEGGAFAHCTGLTSVSIPDSVTSIGDAAFSYCSGLTNIYFRGDRPVVENTIFAEIQPVGIVYYLIGSNGWGSTYAGWPTQPYSLAPTLTPVISNWPSASPITYGQALSNSVLSGGSADVDGSFAWTTPTDVPPVGTNSYSVTFSPVNADTYQTVSTNVPVVVSRYYTQEEYDSFGAQQFSNGQRSVTTNPAAFSLYTESQFAANRITGVAEGKAEVIEVPGSYGLYDSTSIMDLRMGGLMIQKQGTEATIVFQPQTTTDLATLPFTNNGPPITNAIPMPGDKGFLRVGAIYVPAGDLTDVLNNVDVGDTFTY